MVSAVSVWQCCYQCCILLWSRDWGVSITQHQSLLSLSLITPLEHSTHLWSLQAQLNPPNSLCSLTTEILEICQYQKNRYSLIVHDPLPLLLSYCCIIVTVVSSCSDLLCPLQCPLSICKWCQTILVTQPHNKDIVDRIHHLLTLQARTICCHLCLHLSVQILHTTLQANIYNMSLIGLHSPQFLFEMIIDDWRTRDMALERGHRVSEYPSSHSLILHINNFLWPVQYLSNVNVWLIWIETTQTRNNCTQCWDGDTIMTCAGDLTHLVTVNSDVIEHSVADHNGADVNYCWHNHCWRWPGSMTSGDDTHSSEVNIIIGARLISKIVINIKIKWNIFNQVLVLSIKYQSSFQFLTSPKIHVQAI